MEKYLRLLPADCGFLLLFMLTSKQISSVSLTSILSLAWFPIMNTQRGLEFFLCILLQCILKVYNALICKGDTQMHQLSILQAENTSLQHSKWTYFSRWLGLNGLQRSLPNPTILWFCKYFMKEICIWPSEERRFCDSPEVAFKTNFIKLFFPLKSQVRWAVDFPSALTEVKTMGGAGIQQHTASK